MKPFGGLEEIVKADEPMSRHTWLRIGGPATYFIEPRTVEELGQIVLRCRENEIPMYVLGGGANLLVDDSGVRGAVIHLAGPDRRLELAEISAAVEERQQGEHRPRHQGDVLAQPRRVAEADHALAVHLDGEGLQWTELRVIGHGTIR